MEASRFDRVVRRLGGRTTRRTAIGGSLAAFSLGALDQIAAAQATPEPVPADASAPAEKPVFMFVQTAMSGRGEINPAAGTPVVDDRPTAAGGASYLLTLQGHSGQTIYFSDRPDRVVGAVPTEEFLEGLGFTPANPPNAALVGEFEAGDGVVVMQLLAPTYDETSGTLTYGAELLQGYGGENLAAVTKDQLEQRLPAEFESAALFIDDCPDIKDCQIGRENALYIGPIPGGPYGQCWQWWPPSCQPCWYTRWELDAICNNTYSRCGGNCIAYG